MRIHVCALSRDAQGANLRNLTSVGRGRLAAITCLTLNHLLQIAISITHLLQTAISIKLAPRKLGRRRKENHYKYPYRHHFCLVTALLVCLQTQGENAQRQSHGTTQQKAISPSCFLWKELDGAVEMWEELDGAAITIFVNTLGVYRIVARCIPCVAKSHFPSVLSLSCRPREGVPLRKKADSAHTHTGTLVIATTNPSLWLNPPRH